MPKNKGKTMRNCRELPKCVLCVLGFEIKTLLRPPGTKLTKYVSEIVSCTWGNAQNAVELGKIGK